MAIRIRGRKLVFDFRCYLPDGRRVRCVESTGLDDNEKNRQFVEAKWKAIQYELKHGRFNYLHFFPKGSKAKYFKKFHSDRTLAEFWDEWISEKTIRHNTRYGYEKSFKNHIGPMLGHMPLAMIDEHQVLIFRRHLETKGFKETTINTYIDNLCMCLKKAHRRGLIREYPCIDIKNLKTSPVDIDPFSADELIHFLEFLEQHAPMWHDLFFIWSRIGVRPGEMYALKWIDLDYYNAKLMIRCTRLETGVDAPPKTDHSIRDIDLRPPIIDAFKHQEARTRLMDNYIFLNPYNRPLASTFVKRKLRHFLSLSGLKYRTPKQFRHTFATLNLAFGEQISWVAKQLGHAHADTTWKKYNRFIPNLTRQDGSAFEKAMDTQSSRGESVNSSRQFGNNQVTKHHNHLK